MGPAGRRAGSPVGGIDNEATRRGHSFELGAESRTRLSASPPWGSYTADLFVRHWMLQQRSCSVIDPDHHARRRNCRLDEGSGPFTCPRFRRSWSRARRVKWYAGTRSRWRLLDTPARQQVHEANFYGANPGIRTSVLYARHRREGRNAEPAALSGNRGLFHRTGPAPPRNLPAARRLTGCTCAMQCRTSRTPAAGCCSKNVAGHSQLVQMMRTGTQRCSSSNPVLQHSLRSLQTLPILRILATVSRLWKIHACCRWNRRIGECKDHQLLEPPSTIARPSLCCDN